MTRAVAALVALVVLAAPRVRAQEAPAPPRSPPRLRRPSAVSGRHRPGRRSPSMLARARRRSSTLARPAAALAGTRGAPAGDPRVRVLIGVARYHANDPLRAIEELARRASDTLPADSPERREAIQVLGLSHYLAGHLPEAIPLPGADARVRRRQLRAGLRPRHGLHPDAPARPRARDLGARLPRAPGLARRRACVAAQMMVRAEMEDMAQAELTAALQKDPRLPQAHLLLGQAALFRGRLDEAIALFRKELEVNPGNAMAFYRLGDAYTRQLQWDKALDALQRSVWLNPYFSGPYILMGKAYQAKGDRARGGRDAAPRHRLRPQQQDRALPARRRSCSSSAARRRRRRSSRSRSGCRPRPTGDAAVSPLAASLAVALLAGSRRAPSASRPGGLRGRCRSSTWPRAPASPHPSVYGGVDRKRFIIETNGAGVALARLRQRRLARRAGAERHPPRRRRARGRGLAAAARRPPTASTATSATARSRT